MGGMAYEWTANDTYCQELDDCTMQRIQQRYALVVLYYAMDGMNWNYNTGWLSEPDECNWGEDFAWGWYGVACNSNSQMIELRLFGNNLRGTIPSEIVAFQQLEELWLDGNDIT